MQELLSCSVDDFNASSIASDKRVRIQQRSNDCDMDLVDTKNTT